ncbi:MAG: hypothetical protein ACKVOJ_12395 [Sphingomonadaceae bacterium]
MGSIHAIGLASSHEQGEVWAAMIASDGEATPNRIAHIHFAMTEAARDLLRHACDRAATFDRPGPDPLIEEAEQLITMLYVEAVRQVLIAGDKSKADIAAVGLAGHHIAASRDHAPGFAWDWCLGKGDVIAKSSEMTVISGLPRGANGETLQSSAEAVAQLAVRRLRLLPIGDGDLPVGTVHNIIAHR